jgi:hypothetical protein
LVLGFVVEAWLDALVLGWSSDRRFFAGVGYCLSMFFVFLAIVFGYLRWNLLLITKTYLFETIF